MSGYKRVNFYELCRLCASNQQKEKTHIFQEEGRKIQLQNKIQSCLSLTVCENDSLPKVVCSQCLRTLEECYTFRNECVTSETMLSSYFNNFRYTEDFKKSGKVYIKDTTTKMQQKDLGHKQQSNFEFVAVPTGTNNNNNISSSNTEENDNLYISSQNEKIQKSDPNKTLAYNLSTINFAALKGIVQNIPKGDQMNNIAVSSSGEIINITPLIDLESVLVQHQSLKPANKPICKNNKKLKLDKNDLTEADLKRYIHEKYDKLPHIKSTQSNKFAYAIKIEESNKNGGGGSAVVVNQISNMNIPLSNASNNFSTSYSSMQNVNVTNNSVVSQTNNVTTNWNFATPTSNNLNVMGNGNLPGNNNQTVFNQAPNWNLVTTSTNITSNNITQTNNNAVISNVLEQNEKIIQSIQHIPQDNKQNILNGSRNNEIQTVDMSSIKNDQPLKTFSCEICPKVFKRREHLYQHVKLHTGFRPFGCENCKKSFMRKEHLMRHLTSHTGQKNFTCNICEKSFSRNDNLLKHKKTHEKQTSFTCEICQKQFVMKHYYLAHKMGHESSEKCHFWNIVKT